MIDENADPARTITIDVLMFGELREMFGTSVSLRISESCTLDQVREELVRCRPAAAPLLNSSLLAINGQYAKPGQTIAESDEVACIPPVSGG